MSDVRRLGTKVADLFAYALRTGRWWLPVVTVVLGAAAILVTVIKAAVPTVVYVFF